MTRKCTQCLSKLQISSGFSLLVSGEQVPKEAQIFCTIKAAWEQLRGQQDCDPMMLTHLWNFGALSRVWYPAGVDTVMADSKLKGPSHLGFQQLLHCVSHPFKIKSSLSKYLVSFSLWMSHGQDRTDNISFRDVSREAQRMAPPPAQSTKDDTLASFLISFLLCPTYLHTSLHLYHQPFGPQHLQT